RKWVGPLDSVLEARGPSRSRTQIQPALLTIREGKKGLESRFQKLGDLSFFVRNTDFAVPATKLAQNGRRRRAYQAEILRDRMPICKNHHLHSWSPLVGNLRTVTSEQ